MTQFKEPASMEGARSKRASLIAAKQEIQLLLSNLSVGKDGSGRRLSHREVVEARTDAMRTLQSLEGEIRFVKDWITTATEKQIAAKAAEKEEWRRWRVVEDGGGRIHALNEAMQNTRDRLGELIQYVTFLERENAELRAENERLKQEAGKADAINF